MPQKLLYLALVSLPAVFGQQTSGQGSNSSPSGWGTRTIQVKYIDPEQLRDVYSGRSFVMQADRQLKLLTVSGPTQFLDKVEQTAKRLDVAPALPKNIEVTVYLLTTGAQAPAGHGIPQELLAVSKTIDVPTPLQEVQLADTETMRIREGQPSDLSFAQASGLSLTRVSLKSASVTSGPKGDAISLNGLHCWLSKGPGQTSDFTADVDVGQNEVALVAKAGVDKPIAVVVRASILH